MSTDLATIPASAADSLNQLAAQIGSGTLTLDELADISDKALLAQNLATRAVILAERQIAQQYLFDAETYEENVEALKARGWTRDRFKRAQCWDQLTLPQIEEHITVSVANGKEATTTSARKLLPTTPRPAPSNLAHTYTAPPIDVQIARDLGLELSDHLAEVVTGSIQHALKTMKNPKHAEVWAKYHGIQDDGTIGEQWTFDGIAKQRGNSREYVESLYYRASHHVRGQLVIDLLDHARAQLMQ